MQRSGTSTMERDLYTSGEYLVRTGGTWHLEDSAWKAAQVMTILRRNGIEPASVCDIGCGAGGVLHALRADLPRAHLTGYEISPQAHELSQQFADDHLYFLLGDAFEDQRAFDCALLLDVVEHVEDCFSFMRQAAGKATHKVYHFPLDAYCSGILRGSNSWDSAGHLHLFTRETALKSVVHADQQVIDWMLPRNPPIRKEWRARITLSLRRCLPGLLSARLLGGSLLILAK